MSWIIGFGLVFGVIRVGIALALPATTPTLVDVFKDLVHVYMGMLLVLAYRIPHKALQHDLDPMFASRNLFWGLGILEIVCAVVQRLIVR